MRTSSSRSGRRRSLIYRRLRKKRNIWEGTLADTSDEKNGTVVTVSLPDLLTGNEPIEFETIINSIGRSSDPNQS